MHLSTFVLSSVVLTISYYAERYRQVDFERTLDELEGNFGLPVTEQYDFIIVGAGAAGCVVANRLSEKYRVLLLEAGGTPPPPTNVPAFVTNIVKVRELHYEYVSLPQKKASLAIGGVVVRRGGKMLGGSTSHHSFAYNRGNPSDYDNWAARANDSSWRYGNVLKYFKVSENYIGTMYAGDQHGTNGPMAVADGVGPSTALWLEAGSELGYRSTDPNGPQTESFATLAETKQKGRRVSSYTAFIQPIEKGRANLRIIRYATAENILVDEQKRAFGVRYYRHGIPQTAHATKEVIISTGAFASPLLLMKSGIGSKDLLNQAKIPLVADLPVGIGLQDHATVRLRGFRVNDTSLFPTIGSSWTNSSIEHYLNNNGAGILNAALGGQMFMVSSRAIRDLQPNWPDIHILFKPDVFNPQPETPQEIFFDVVLGRPKSRGYISLNTSAYLNGERDAEKLSVIDYQLLEDETDVDVLIEGIKMALKIAENTTAFQRIGTTYAAEPHKNCAHHEFRSDVYWRCLVGQLGAPWFHLAGSCRMGYGPGDKFAVVDSKLRVLGVTNLRVIDGSVMPRTPNSNTAAPVTMIGEKGSAMILEAWNPS